ncbi:MAG: hypothetical protein IT324_22595 [Anaerolineae bacterium]|nr:hypothetical protein [Anaerolineae bacterium]
MKRLMWLTGIIGILTLAACSQPENPGKVAESYWQARVASDLNKMLSLSCKAYEGDARTEAVSFQSMKASLEGMACTADSEQGSDAVVSCKGDLKTTYAGETRTRSLADKKIKMLKEDGQWKVCGYE